MRAALPRVAPFAVFIVLLAAQPLLAPVVGHAFDPRWLYAVRALVTGALLLLFWRRYVELRNAPPVRAPAWLAGLAVGIVVFLLWIALDFPPLVTGAGSGYDPRVGGAIHPGLALTRLAGAALVVPAMEELFWRSFLMRWVQGQRFLDVDPARVGWKGLLITSAVFALEHRLWLAGLLAGLAYGELYRRTRNLWVAILAHAVTNGLLGAWVLATGSWTFW